MDMRPDPTDADCRIGDCDRCNAVLERWPGQGDITCHWCGAIYNASGQRLRDDLYSHRNPSDDDDEIGDLEGYEIAMTRAEQW